MLWQRIYLGVFGTIFLVSGIFTFFDPEAMGAALGIAPVNVSGETQIRATYGGLVVGSGLLLLCGLRSRVLAVGALAGTLFGGGGLVLTRIVIEIFFGESGLAINQAIVIVFEIIMIALTWILLRRAIRDYELSIRAGGLLGF